MNGRGHRKKLEAAAAALRWIAAALSSAAAFSGAALAQPYADGLYELADEDTGRPVVAADGTRYWLGARLDVALEERSVVSIDNANERFHVTVRYAADTPAVSVRDLLSASVAFPHLVLVVDGVQYVSDQSGFGPGQTTVGFEVAGAANAERIARYFETEVLYRRHPGHRLRVRFTPPQQTVEPNGEVPVVLEITNVGDAAVTFYNAPRFRFFAERSGESVPRAGWVRRAGGFTAPTLGPGETYRLEADVARWLRFDTPGRYYVFGSYHLELVEDAPSREHTIWGELVSGQFEVLVEP